MKVISLHTDKKLIKKAIKHDRSAQNDLYKRYAPKMLSVCRMYVKDLHFAEDVMIKGFLKVFKNLKTFKHQGSFEGWIRRIMVRQAIDFLRVQKQLDFSEDMENDFHPRSKDDFGSFDTDYIQNKIDQLPEGYKVVFVMYAVEGYKHREIAEILNISEGTSKSQLFKARRILQNALIKEEEYER